MKFAWSDLHIGHENVLKYCRESRPFANADEMAAHYAKLWDAVVKPGDEVYLAGDISMNPKKGSAFLAARPGVKFISWGNHDGKREKDRAPLAELCAKTGDVLDISWVRADGTKQKVIMCHYPMLRWKLSHHGSWMLHGHTHGDLTYPYPMKIKDVGVDVFTKGPVSFEELDLIMAPFPTIHHHRDED